MCNNCNNSSCNGCCVPQPVAQICHQFPPPQGYTGPTGPTGPSGSSGTAVEFGGFSRLAGQGSGAVVINTVNEVQLLFLTATELIPVTGSGSIGVGSPAQNSCTANDTGLFSIDPNNSIRMVVGGNGFTAVISAIATNSFAVTWTIVGAGADVSVNWQAIVKI